MYLVWQLPVCELAGGRTVGGDVRTSGGRGGGLDRDSSRTSGTPSRPLNWLLHHSVCEAEGEEGRHGECRGGLGQVGQRSGSYPPLALSYLEVHDVVWGLAQVTG